MGRLAIGACSSMLSAVNFRLSLPPVTFRQQTVSRHNSLDQHPASITIVIRLERSLRRDADVGGLLVTELGQLDSELVEVDRSDLLVEVLGQDIDVILVGVGLGPQLDLGENLVGEAAAHHKARVTGG